MRLDVTAIDKGVASQGCFDGSFDVSQTHRGLNDDVIADARDPVQCTQRARPLPLLPSTPPDRSPTLTLVLNVSGTRQFHSRLLIAASAISSSSVALKGTSTRSVGDD
jgi:hypothetical protein